METDFNSHSPTGKNVLTVVPSGAQTDDDELSAGAAIASVQAVLLRRWKFLVFAFLSSLGIAFGASTVLSSWEWTYMSSLLYHRSGSGSPFTPTDVHTWSSLIKSPELIKQVKDEFHLGQSLKRISQAYTVEVPRGSDSIDLRFKWNDPELTETILNRTMELFTDQVAKTRKATLKRYLVEYQSELESAKRDQAKAKGALLAFEQEHKLVDFEKELMRVSDDVSTLQLLLETSRVKQGNLRAQLAKLTAMQNEIVEVNEKPGGMIEKAIAGRVASGDLRRRRDYLEAKIRDERETAIAMAELNAKEQEFARVRALHEKRYVNDAAVEQVERELKALTLKADGNDSIRRWKTELKLIDQLIPPDSSSASDRSSTSPVTYELDLVATQGEIAHLEQYLANRRQELDRIKSFRKQALSLKEEVESANGARLRAELQAAALQQLQQSDVKEFVVVQPATPMLDPITSNRFKLFAGLFVLTGLVIVAPVAGSEFKAARPQRSQSLARRLSLPVLADRQRLLALQGETPDEAAVDGEYARLLALRIQQSAGKPGYITLLSSLADESAPMELLVRLCEALAKREQRVLLIDANYGAEAASLFQAAEQLHRDPENVLDEDPDGETTVRLQGLAEYLSNSNVPVRTVIQSTAIPGVDGLGPGRAALPEEAWSSRRLTELLSQAALEYSVILIAGPSVTKPIDLEMIAARTDGIIFSAVGKVSPSAQAEATVRELLQLGAPVMGVII